MESQFRLILQPQPGAASVYVHRDFMPRNLMIPRDPARDRGWACSISRTRVTGRITYDIAVPDARCLPELGRGVRARTVTCA
jgi:aminoglycoside/choline kinase family phosphotransferase